MPALFHRSLLIVVFFAAAATPAFAASSINLFVTATIANRCGFLDSTAITIDFGGLNATSGLQTQMVSRQFWCTQGLNYTLSLGRGQNASGEQRRMKASTSEQFLPYSLSVNPAEGTGTGQSKPISATLTATISADNLSSAAIDHNYSDTVVLTLYP